jgi:hypothetical protein
MDSTLPLKTALELEMSPHLASFNRRKIRNFGTVAGSWSDAEPVARTSLSSPSRRDVVENGWGESRPWKRHVVIGSILGSELAVILGLLASLARRSTDPRQSAWTLGLLSIALLALSLLRRKTLPTASECQA